MAKKKYKHHFSSIANADRAKQIIRDNYEPGNQSKSKMAIYRNKVFPELKIDVRTFWRYMHEVENELKEPDKEQLKMDF